MWFGVGAKFGVEARLGLELGWVGMCLKVGGDPRV